MQTDQTPSAEPIPQEDALIEWMVRSAQPRVLELLRRVFVEPVAQQLLPDYLEVLRKFGRPLLRQAFEEICQENLGKLQQHAALAGLRLR